MCQYSDNFHFDKKYTFTKFPHSLHYIYGMSRAKDMDVNCDLTGWSRHPTAGWYFFNSNEIFEDFFLVNQDEFK